jgi:hypothetical protein
VAIFKSKWLFTGEARFKRSIDYQG